MQANIKALFAPLDHHDVVNVACGGMTSLNQLWRMICNDLGVKIDPVYAPQRTGDIKHSLASIEKAKRLFDYRPFVQMDDGLKQTVEWGKTNGF